MRDINSSIFSVKIVGNEQFDSFILQVRGPRNEEGNATFPGKWIKIPKIAKTINCNKYREAAIIDKGIPYSRHYKPCLLIRPF